MFTGNGAFFDCGHLAASGDDFVSDSLIITTKRTASLQLVRQCCEPSDGSFLKSQAGDQRIQESSRRQEYEDIRIDEKIRSLIGKLSRDTLFSGLVAHQQLFKQMSVCVAQIVQRNVPAQESTNL